MLTMTQRAGIKAKLLLQEYDNIHELLSEFPPEVWQQIWKSSPHLKLADPEKLILRDLLRTAEYFQVTLMDIVRLAE